MRGAGVQRYRIMDEPSPSSLAKWAVKPYWPLLATMMAGSWLAAPWFIFNGFALGSPTRRREIALAALALVGSAALALALLWLDQHVALGRRNAQLALLSITAWKLGLFYLVTLTQTRTLGIYLHFGGPIRSGVWLLIAGSYLRVKALAALPLLLSLVLS
jgi:hypothetical protein